MAGYKIEQRVMKLKKDAVLPNGITFKAGTEIEIVMDVVYMGGYPIPPALQPTLYNWISDNPNLFINETRRF